MPLDRARIAFGPEALSRFTQIIEEVAVDLVDDGLPAELMRSEEMRTRLAQRLLSFAHSWWTDTQIKQLLLRGLRNEISASSTYATVAGIETGADGNFNFNYLIEGATENDYITASATSTVYSTDGLNVTINGSEFSNAVKAGGIIPETPARVTQVFVNGQGITGQTSANGIAFRNLAGVDNTFGYPVPGGANQLKSIPWSNGINKISLRFDQDVAGTLAQGDLVVRGINTANYAISGFTYDAATKTGTWTLTTPITNDKVNLFLDDANVGGLDGEWTTAQAYPSGNGTAGGDFTFRLNVQRGDANQDGSVNALDLGQLKSKLNRTATNPGTGTSAYSPFADLNADGQINALDLGIAKARLNNRLPNGEPARKPTSSPYRSRR